MSLRTHRGPLFICFYLIILNYHDFSFMLEVLCIGINVYKPVQYIDIQSHPMSTADVFWRFLTRTF